MTRELQSKLLAGAFVLSCSASACVAIAQGAVAASTSFPSCGQWGKLVGDEPAGRMDACAAFDELRHRMVVFGGSGMYSVDLFDTWALDAATGQWTNLSPKGKVPPLSTYNSLVYDSLRDRMILFGGIDFTLLRQLTFPDSGGPTWALVPVAPTSPQPPARQSAAAIYDPLRDRVLVFGGYSQSANHALNDVWELTLAGTPTWHELTPAAPLPVPRWGAAAVYDAFNDRMIVCGGTTPNFYMNEIWALSLSGTPAWSRLLSSLGTIAGYEPTAVYDPVRARMIVFGGQGPNDPPNHDVESNDVHIVSLESQPIHDLLPPAGDVPSGRSSHVAAYDPATRRMMVFGGWSYAVERPTGTYILDLGDNTLDAGANVFERGTVARDVEKICYDPGESVTLTATANSGNYFNGWLGDASGTTNPLTVTMDHSKTIVAEFLRDPAAVGDGAAAGFALGAVRPNPTRRLARVDYTVGRSGPVLVSVLDVTGREVARLVDGVRSAGAQVATWDARAGRARAGVYFVRYQTAAGSWTRSFALMP